MAVISAVGMLIGIVCFGSAVTAIAPGAVYEVELYVAAAIIGIGVGIKVRSN